MKFASLLASRLATRSSSLSFCSSQDECASVSSSQGICASTSSESSSLSTLDSQSCASDPGSAELPVIRRNEHLAVLLPKHLWKPDAQASHCDIFLCRKKFSIWERRHHCRKCGGVFCNDCSSRATTLLNTSNLEFFFPPHDIPISTFGSPTSPVVLSRVCDHCWDLVHGVRTPRSPPLGATASIALLQDAIRESDSSASSIIVSAPSTPSDRFAPVARPKMRRAHTTSPRIPSSPLRSPVRSLQNLIVDVNVVERIENAPPVSADFSELLAYPLRHPSAICKANGGGRWEPKQAINLIGPQIPGEKAPHEIELEREEEERRRWKANPVIIDGDFKLRVPREPAPRSPGGPIQFATF
ncbi:uncharacterized protein LAESUDRAFT_723230 [Laetiporus sulphureus 93-53]|uniref:FYVE-type domain-containing protein n=1 Tax=Laetiporus sulphureus 93-53 TaxID=1314785 RepID=A0A165FGH6_9APHY|nr:uncharacterized protein LAESUDRAFT_723230 [Laetiporus sulphureus 93-53]KZT08935.1 hypothetical protein LAESUDRAFT_723230 [Laetiporus sulphureus 93-53]